MSLFKVTGARALVVDDYENIRQMLVAMLRDLGMTVVEVDNGVAAIELLRLERFDIMFTDLIMPQMDGFELCEETRKIAACRNLPLVVVSTFSDSAYIARALRRGADDFLGKPVSRELLEKVIARVTLPGLEAAHD